MRILGRMNRRAFLLGVSSTGLCFSSAFAKSNRTHYLVVIKLKGGLDSLAAFPSTGDAHFSKVRSVRHASDAIQLDGYFAAHPGLSALQPFFTRGELLIFPATSTSYRGSCHSEAQAILDAAGSHGDRNNWISRAATALDVFSERRCTHDREVGGDVLARLVASCGETASWFVGSTASMADPREYVEGSIGAKRREAFLTACSEAGQSIGDASGSPITELSLEGFDTHFNQYECIREPLQTLGLGIAKLAAASHHNWTRTVVIVISEFGRTLVLNRDGGTDHGRASATMVLGKSVLGGRIAGPWPKLDRRHGWGHSGLEPTVPVSGILKTILTEHMRIPKPIVDIVVLRDTLTAPVGDVLG